MKLDLRSLSVLAALALGPTIPSAADAGEVDIRSCADAAPGARDDAWSYRSDNGAGFERAPSVCPPDGVPVGNDLSHAQIPGLTIWTRLNSGVAPVAGEGAEWRFVAPGGTRIRRMRLERDIGTRNDGYYVYGKTDAAQLDNETCTLGSDDFTCSRGRYGNSDAEFTNLNTAWVAWGFRCVLALCTTGSILHEAWVHIYGSTVTLTDEQPPGTPAVGGALTTAGRKGGSVGATVTASDNLGIRTVRWYADGAPLSSGTTTRTCDFSTPVPCSNLAGDPVALDTTRLADGTHTLQLGVVDPAGNEARSSTFTVDVDNTPPPPAMGGGGGGGGGGATPGAKPTAPPTPVTSPLGPPTAPVPPGAAAATPAPPVPAATPARIAAGVRIARADLSRRTALLVVRGSLDRRATGSVTVIHRARLRGRWRAWTTTARIRHGRYRAALRLPRPWLRAGAARVTVRYRGSSTVRRASRSVVVRV